MRYLVIIFVFTLTVLTIGQGSARAANTPQQLTPNSLAYTAVQTTTLPYEFEVYDLDDPDAPALPLPDLLNVPFINQVGSLALTLFALFDQYKVLSIFVILLIAMLITFWLWSFITGTPSQVTLRASEGFDVAGRVIDAQSENIQQGIDYYEQNHLVLGPGAHQQYQNDVSRLASNKRLSSGFRQGGKILRRAKRDFGGNPFK